MAGDEQIRAQIMQARQILELTQAECWHLLASVSLGRVVFMMHAMPAIRPVNHLVDDEMIIVRSHLGSAIVARHGRGTPRSSATKPTTWTRSGTPAGA